MNNDDGPEPWTASVGRLQLRYLPDAATQVTAKAWYPDTPESAWTDSTEYLTTGGHLPISAGALLIDGGGGRVLVDSGMGDIPGTTESRPPYVHAYRYAARLPESLHAAGVDPRSIDMVLITHGHSDHTGWVKPPNGSISPLRGVPVLAGRRSKKLGLLRGPGSVDVQTVDDGERVANGIHAWALPGHFDGHTGYVFNAGDGLELIAFGDVMHSPAQVRHPNWPMALDTDADAARRSREAVIDRLEQSNAVGYGMHFGRMQLGRISRQRWHPAATPPRAPG